MIDFETAYGWLNTFHYSCLGAATRQIVAQLSLNLRPEKPARLQALRQQLLVVSDTLRYSDERAECLLACARAEYRLQDFTHASLHLQQAAGLYRRFRMTHQYAVTLWLRGWLLWNLPGHPEAWTGLTLLQESVRQFQLLHGMNMGIDGQQSAWYRAKAEAMQEAIGRQVSLMEQLDEAAGEQQPPAVPPAPGAWEREYPAEEPPGVVLEPGAEAPIPVELPPAAPPEYLFTLQTFEVREWIPAGGLKSMNTLPQPLGHVELDRVLIGGQCYEIKPLWKNGTRINVTRYLNNRQPLVVLRVRGDSMNAVQPHPIENGDYVLVVLQNHARDGDIVVAGADQEATLKRLRVRGRQRLLEPESRNSDHQPRSFAHDETLIISGIALAVFKPAE